MLVICDFCKREFSRSRSHVEQYQNNFCSLICSDAWKLGKPSKKRIIQVNDRIDDLKVLEEFREGKRLFYTCQCKCGKKVKRRSDHLAKLAQLPEIASCGCQHKRHRTGQRHGRWRGYKSIPSQYYHNIKGHAEKRNISWEITIQDMWNQLMKQNFICSLTGLQLYMAESRKDPKPTTASLDRIDSSKPYTTENIQWVHKDINRMKMNFDQDYYIEMCRLVSNHSSYYYTP